MGRASHDRQKRAKRDVRVRHVLSVAGSTCGFDSSAVPGLVAEMPFHHLRDSRIPLVCRIITLLCLTVRSNLIRADSPVATHKSGSIHIYRHFQGTSLPVFRRLNSFMCSTNGPQCFLLHPLLYLAPLIVSNCTTLTSQTLSPSRQAS